MDSNAAAAAMVLAANSSADPGQPKACFSTLPFEIKLMIWALLEEERLIKFTCSKSTPVAAWPCIWLTGRVKPPVTLGICGDSRADALTRYLNLGDPYDGLYVNPKLDIVQIKVPYFTSGDPSHPALGARAFRDMEKFSFVLDSNWEGWSRMLYRLGKTFSWAEVFPNLRSLYIEISDFDLGWIKMSRLVKRQLGALQAVSDDDYKKAVLRWICVEWEARRAKGAIPGREPSRLVDFDLLT